MNASTATADTPRGTRCSQIATGPWPACEVEGKVHLRREIIERGGSSEAWYGGQARPSRPLHTVSSMPRPLGALHARLAWRLVGFVTNRHE